MSTSVLPSATPNPSSLMASSKSMRRRVALSVLIGTTIEWYDFILYSTAAALVFGPLYFPSDSPTTSTLIVFSTFAVGFAARPLGGIVLGHFGDRVGRKKMLVLTLSMMGVATFFMGLLPTYQQIGIAAPITLVLLRLVQGFGVGGEWGGAVLTAVEHSSPKTRGLYGSLPQIGVPFGLVLATAAFIGVSQLPEEAFLSWGWRIPFLVSIVLVGIGLWIRLTLEESPVFTQVKEYKKEARVPLIEAIRTYPKQILLATGSVISTGAYFYVVHTFAMSYTGITGSISRTVMLTAVLTSAIIMVVALPIFGVVAQRYGRRRMVMIGIAAMAVWVFPVFLAIDSGSVAWVLAIYAVGAVIFSISYSAHATFIAELFDARVRFSAASTSFQLGVLLGGAIAPLVATALITATGTSMVVATYVFLVSVVSLVSVVLISQDDIDRGSRDLGGQTQGAATTGRKGALS